MDFIAKLDELVKKSIQNIEKEMEDLKKYIDNGNIGDSYLLPAYEQLLKEAKENEVRVKSLKRLKSFQENLSDKNPRCPKCNLPKEKRMIKSGKYPIYKWVCTNPKCVYGRLYYIKGKMKTKRIK